MTNQPPPSSSQTPPENPTPVSEESQAVPELTEQTESAQTKKPLGTIEVFIRDFCILAIIGPAIEFFIGYFALFFFETRLWTWQVLPIYGHTSIIAPLFFGLFGALFLQFYRKFLI